MAFSAENFPESSNLESFGRLVVRMVRWRRLLSGRWRLTISGAVAGLLGHRARSGRGAGRLSDRRERAAARLERRYRPAEKLISLIARKTHGHQG